MKESKRRPGTAVTVPAGQATRAARRTSRRWTPALRSTASSSTEGSPRRRSARTAPTSAHSRLPRSRGLTLDAVDARALSDWVAALGSGRDRLAPPSISRRLAAVRSCLRFTFGPAAVPEASLSPSRARRLPDAPKTAEIDELLELVDGDSPLALRNRALLELLYSAGLRSQEAVTLDLVDVDFDREVVHVRGKGGKERVVPLGEEAALQLARYLRVGQTGARGRRERRLLPVRRAAAVSTRARCDGYFAIRIASATRSRPTSSKAAPTSASSRSCWGTRRSRRRRSTATSTPAGCGASTTGHILGARRASAQRAAPPRSGEASSRPSTSAATRTSSKTGAHSRGCTRAAPRREPH